MTSLWRYLRWGGAESRPQNQPPRLTDVETDQYAAISSEFDHDYYLRRYDDIAKARIDPVRHFIEHGAREGRDPSPEFSTSYYLKRYPDVVGTGLNPYYHYLTVGRVEGRGATPLSDGDEIFDAFCQILGCVPAEVEQDLTSRRRDLRARIESGVLRQLVVRAGELEPLIHHSWLAAMTTNLAPFNTWGMTQVIAMHRLQTAAEWRRAQAVVVTRASEVRGAARIAGHLATALAELYGRDEIVVLRTDSSEMRFPGWFPDDCRQVDFAGIAQNLHPDARQRLLVEFLRSLRPAALFNVHSPLLWDAMLPYGRALASSMALYAYFFCNELNIHGQWTGYPIKQFYRHFDNLRCVITDSNFYANELRTRFQIPPAQTDKLVTLSTPIINSLPLVPCPSRSERRRPQIFWAGRLDRQKRVDVVMLLASRLPEMDFRLWGMPVLDDSFRDLQIPSNVFIEGLYKDFAELPLERCDMWLYTSQWDGVPNVLLEVAASGIPLVGSLAGGTGEVLLEGLCHRISNVEDIAAFEAAIRAVLRDPTTSRERAARLRELMLTQRDPAVYRSALKKLLPAGASE